MSSGSETANRRRGNRTKAVFPVRIKGKDSAGLAFEELAHTLDVTTNGVRLGSVHHELNLHEEITVFFRQRRMQFRVVWITKLKGTSEYQAGLQAVTQEKELWGLSASEHHAQAVPQLSAQASGAA